MKAAPKKPKTRRGRSGAALAESPRSSANSLDLLDEIARQIPKNVLRRLPRDLAKNVDHYLYGAPKR